MDVTNSNFEDDEIDLGELFSVLWSHKVLIILLTGLSIFLAGYHSNYRKNLLQAQYFRLNNLVEAAGLTFRRARGSSFFHELFYWWRSEFQH